MSVRYNMMVGHGRHANVSGLIRVNIDPAGWKNMIMSKNVREVQHFNVNTHRSD